MKFINTFIDVSLDHFLNKFRAFWVITLCLLALVAAQNNGVDGAGVAIDWFATGLLVYVVTLFVAILCQPERIEFHAAKNMARQRKPISKKHRRWLRILGVRRLLWRSTIIAYLLVVWGLSEALFSAAQSGHDVAVIKIAVALFLFWFASDAYLKVIAFHATRRFSDEVSV